MLLFMQMNARKGIKTFGEEAVAALIKEFSQLRFKNKGTQIFMFTINFEFICKTLLF